MTVRKEKSDVHIQVYIYIIDSGNQNIFKIQGFYIQKNMNMKSGSPILPS